MRSSILTRTLWREMNAPRPVHAGALRGLCVMIGITYTATVLPRDIDRVFALATSGLVTLVCLAVGLHAPRTTFRQLVPIGIVLGLVVGVDALVAASHSAQGPADYALTALAILTSVALQRTARATLAFAVGGALGFSALVLWGLGFREPTEMAATTLTAIAGGVTLGLIQLATQAHLVRTERKSRMQEHQLELARSRMEFLTNVGHELRTPLYALSGIVESLRDEVDSPSGRTRMRHATHALRKLRTQFDDLIDLSVIHSGRLRVGSVAFDAVRMIEHVEGMTRTDAAEQHVELYVDASGIQPSRLKGDPRRLEQILGHLISNAIKFTSEGSVQVRVWTEPDPSRPSDTGATLVLEVSDTGIGIAPDELARVREPFVQVDGSTTRRYQGLGMGLTLVHELLHAMNGELRVESELGTGSRFTVRIPVDIPMRRRRVVGERRILLVDDNETNLVVGRALLESLGHRVITARGGQECIDLTHQHAFDAIFMDVQMPGVDGVQATRAIRATEQQTARVPIIALTAHGLVEDEIRCYQAGMDGYLVKPVSTEELEAALEALSSPAA